MRTTLYRYYDARGGLLYVGISKHWTRRFEEHRSTKDWIDEVASVRIEHYETRSEALRAESRAISAETPLYNVSGAATWSDLIDATPELEEIDFEFASADHWGRDLAVVMAESIETARRLGGEYAVELLTARYA